MTRTLPYSALAVLLIFVCSCAGPVVHPATNSNVMRSAAQSLSKDAWGHRAGPRGFHTVVIDAGHGGRDPGASVAGVHEKNLALDTALRLKRHLQRDFNVVLLRDSDRFVDLDSRASQGSKRSGAIFLSIHYNHGPRWVRGPETYYWRVDSHGLAKRIQDNMKKVSSRESRSSRLVRRRLRLTRNVKIPSVLIEVGYLSNRSERAAVSRASYREQMATAISSAVRDQAMWGDAGTGAKPVALWSPVSRKGDKDRL